MDRRDLVNRVRLTLGLPLLAAGCATAGASGVAAPAEDACTVDLEVTDANRDTVVATFAGDRALGIPSLDTLDGREAWVTQCLSDHADWPAVCDLRRLIPFDASWWNALPGEPDPPLPPASLTWFEHDTDARPCEKATWAWTMARHAKVDPRPYSATRILVHSVDASTGETVQSVSTMIIPGRPFASRVADHEQTDSGLPDTPWVTRALGEHASVAAFARHLLELMSLGAPTELLMAVTTAQADEVRHTQLCLQRARAYGADLTLGALDVDVPTRRSAFDIALGTALEGCVNETLSAMDLLDEAERATGEDRTVLLAIAEDEVGHAALAWRTLAWLMPRLTRREQRRIRKAMHLALPDAHRAELQPCVRALAA